MTHSCVCILVFDVSWVLHDKSDAHHPLSPLMKLGLRHPRKKERKKERKKDARS